MAQILEDTRQQQHHGDKHANKHAWWGAHGVEVERRKLDFGDYMRADGTSNIAIDTKRSIEELAGNVGRDHDRFVRELERARESGWRLVVMVEVGRPYKALADVNGWTPYVCRRCRWYKDRACSPHGSDRCRSYRTKPMQGPTLYKMLKTLERKHGAVFEVCPPGKAARRICEILGVAYGE